MIPSDECLRADEPARVGVDDRLVVDLELTSLQALSDPYGRLEAKNGVGVHVRAVHLEATFSVALGEIHGEVRIPQEIVRRLVRSPTEGDADARPYRHIIGLDAKRRRQALGDALGDRLGRFGHGARLDQDGELVATETGHRVPGRVEARMRSATATSSRSPAGCPKLSLMALKSSRSKNSTPTGSAPRSPLSMAWESRSRNRARLARPVRVSWNAW